MTRPPFSTTWRVASFLAVSLLAFAAPQIPEFMAVNDTTLADEDGDFSDWIEIHYPDGLFRATLPPIRGQLFARSYSVLYCIGSQP